MSPLFMPAVLRGVAALCLFVVCSVAAAAERGDFSFIHMSDTHIGPYEQMPSDEALQKARSYAAVQTIRTLDGIALTPFGIGAPKPSFIIHTGDVGEFGFPGQTFDVVQKYFGNLGIPVCYVMGNHDNTWVPVPEKFRAMRCSLNYSFDFKGIHFALINSATLQAPNPSIGEEVLDFLRKDLGKLEPNTPIMVALHHPLNTSEFCSRYDTDRLVDLLHQYNVALMLYGHGHGATRATFSFIDAVQGGSPFSKDKPQNEGYSIIDIQGGRISVAYRCHTEKGANKPLLQKTIASRPLFPAITIHSPRENQQLTSTMLPIQASIAAAPGAFVTAWCDIDDNTSVSLPLNGMVASGQINLGAVTNGAHFIRINFADAKGLAASRSTCVYVDVPNRADSPVARWRYKMGGGSKATPLVTNGRVYVGANDGMFYALDEMTGGLVWKIDAGGEILGTAAAYGGQILFGTASGKFLAVGADGKARWAYDAGNAIFSSPVVDNNGVVYFGTNGAKLIALRADTGQLVWQNSDAGCGIESQPFVSGGCVYFGAWDGYLYCVDKNTGKTLWKSLGVKSSSALKTYYAPADNGPVVCGGFVFVADRGYLAGRYDQTGKLAGKLAGSHVAVGLSQDGNAVYLRSLESPVSKVDGSGRGLWKSSVRAGSIPVSPVEADGMLLVCNNSGTLYAMNPTDGKTLWKYDVSPSLYVMSGAAASNGGVFTTGLDGVVTAIQAGQHLE